MLIIPLLGRGINVIINLNMEEKFYITTPIYYANAKPHLGHAFTAVYADVIARWQKNKEKKVFFTVGTDEHGVKIAEAAKKAGKNPQNFVDEVSEEYKKTWQTLNIEYSNFVRTTSDRHKKGVLAFVEKIYKSGDIYEGVYEGLYCAGCENFVLERNLKNGLCPDHLIAPKKVKEKNYFFNLKKYLLLVKEKIAGGELKITPESRKNEILSIIDAGVPDFSITRESVKWGIPFPYDKKQTIYVWVDALTNYITVLDFPDGENYKNFWPADAHIVGADINKFHSIFWPAMLISAGLPLPKSIFVHGLFTVNGQKMSKTLGNVIDPIDTVNKFGADAARYLALSQFPAGEHGDVKPEGFADKYNSDLANGVGNLLERSLTMIIDFHGGIIDEKAEVEEKIKFLAEKTEKKYENNFENYKLYEALADVFSFIKRLDRYINKEQPWVLNKNSDPKLDKVLNTLFFGINKVAEWLAPFMPSKMEEVKNYIAKMRTGELNKGEKLGLFPRI